jgi:hypothetical protein
VDFPAPAIPTISMISGLSFMVALASSTRLQHLLMRITETDQLTRPELHGGAAPKRKDGLYHS